MARRTDVIKALDGIVYDQEHLGDLSGWRSSQRLSYVLDRIARLRKSIDLERKTNGE